MQEKIPGDTSLSRRHLAGCRADVLAHAPAGESSPEHVEEALAATAALQTTFYARPPLTAGNHDPDYERTLSGRTCTGNVNSLGFDARGDLVQYDQPAIGKWIANPAARTLGYSGALEPGGRRGPRSRGGSVHV
jgi:hypothetical protein